MNQRSSGRAGTVGQQGLLPTHADPKLWIVETRTGEEREAVVKLLQKAVTLGGQGRPLLIKSAFTQDHLKARGGSPPLGPPDPEALQPPALCSCVTVLQGGKIEGTWHAA